jgi:hypothetical protein
VHPVSLSSLPTFSSQANTAVVFPTLSDSESALKVVLVA